MAGVYSVEQVNSYIKNMFVSDFVLNRISVKGEVSNCKYHTSGHIYFTLKDNGGTLSAVMFQGSRSGLAFKMCDGQKVVVSGKISIYERDGKYQLYAQKITLDGDGELYEKFMMLKKELEEMGMFDSQYKQKIPAFSKKVGIVTASTGAAIQDIINISKRRNPYVQLILYPALVQGDGAVASICEGITRLDEYGVDVIIVGRGGGSIEDLWAFNDEAVARTIFDCRTPVISAVGHETDFTIADFVADLRAPTPSAAAELAVCDINQYTGQLEYYMEQLDRAMKIAIQNIRVKLDNYSIKLKYLSPETKILNNRQYLSELTDRLNQSADRMLLAKKHQLGILSTRLDGLSPLSKLSHGYSYVTDDNNINVKSVKNVNTGDNIFIHVTDGIIEGQVTGNTLLERTIDS